MTVLMWDGACCVEVQTKIQTEFAAAGLDTIDVPWRRPPSGSCRSLDFFMYL